MKTLKTHILLYDNQCPLCQGYSELFVKANILERKGRIAYQDAPHITCPLLDRKKACNEIALVNTATNTITYGIDSIIELVSHPLPFLKRILRIYPIYQLLKFLYSFISYNRKVMLPPKIQNDSCTPDFHLKYRILYLCFSWICTALLLHHFSQFISWPKQHNLYTELIICGGQIFFQYLILHTIPFQKKITYLGNMMTISLTGGLLLLCFSTLLSLFTNCPAEFYNIAFLLVVCWMLKEHLRRCKLLETGVFPTISWVLYRILILIILVL